MTIGIRLRELAEGKWGKRGAIKKLADALGVKMSNLYIYLKDQSKPGTELLLKLNELGFDLNYLLNGIKSDDPEENVNSVFKYQQGSYREEQIKMMKEENQLLIEEIKKLKKKIAVYEKAARYMAKAESS